MRQQSLNVSQLDLLLSLIIYGSYQSVPSNGVWQKEVEIRILHQRKLVDKIDEDDFRINDRGSALVDLMKAVSAVKI